MKLKPTSTMPEPKSVGLWIRVSTEDQAKGESPEHHLERGKAYAIAKGWMVKEVYDLAGISGKSVKDYPEAKRMLADVKRGHITGLIFSKLARLARNTRELLDFSDHFRSCNADLISLQETIDTSTPAGRLFFTMIAAMAQWEREEIVDRVNASIAVRAKLGKPLSGVAPYGYRWVDRKLTLHPDESPIRRRAYELFVEHRRKGVVARLLNEAGHRTRAGAKWRDVTVDRVLRCPSAKGVYYLNRTRQTGSWQWEQKPESEWATLHVDPLVPATLWDQCSQLLEERIKKHKRPGRKPVQLLGSMTFCACGQKMYVRSKSPKYVCTKCRNKIPIVDLEGVLIEELKVYFTNTEAIARHLNEASQNLSSKEQLLATQRAEITSVREEMTRTHKLYLAGQIALENFGDYHKPLEERLKQLKTELPRLEAELDYLKINRLSADEVISEANTLYDRWPSLPMDDKRKIVESIVEKVVIGTGNEIELTFSYLPSSEELTKCQQVLRRR